MNPTHKTVPASTRNTLYPLIIWFCSHAPTIGTDQTLSFKVLLGAFASHQELSDALSDLEENWYLGLESDPGWEEAVLAERPHLFSVAVVDNDTSHRRYR